MGYLTAESIDVARPWARCNRRVAGALARFVGTVRNHHDGRHVLRLEYSAYGPMAEAECARIVAEAESKWPVGVVLRHRVGILEVVMSATSPPPPRRTAIPRSLPAGTSWKR